MKEKVLFVMFDAKMKTAIDKKKYAAFIKNLKREGYKPLQKSIFMKHYIGTNDIAICFQTLKRFVPDTIATMFFSMTVDQYKKINCVNCQLPALIKNKTTICI